MKESENKVIGGWEERATREEKGEESLDLEASDMKRERERERQRVALV